MSGECLRWQWQRLLNCISCNAQGAKLESISLGAEKLKEKKNSSVSVTSSSSTDHSQKNLGSPAPSPCLSIFKMQRRQSAWSPSINPGEKWGDQMNNLSCLLPPLLNPAGQLEPWETQQGTEKFQGKWQKGVCHFWQKATLLLWRKSLGRELQQGKWDDTAFNFWGNDAYNRWHLRCETLR